MYIALTSALNTRVRVLAHDHAAAEGPIQRCDQLPDGTRAGVVEPNLSIERTLDHLNHHDVAEPAFGRRLRYWPTSLRPPHPEASISVAANNVPFDPDGAVGAGQGAVLGRVGGELVERHADGLSRGWPEPKRRAVQDHARPDEITKVRQLRSDEVGRVHPSPVGLDEQVMAGGEPGETVAKALSKHLGVNFPGGLPCHDLHHGQQGLGPMTDLAHEQLNVLLGLLARRNVSNDAHHAYRGAIGVTLDDASPGAQPANFTIPSSDSMIECDIVVARTKSLLHCHQCRAVLGEDKGKALTPRQRGARLQA